MTVMTTNVEMPHDDGLENSFRVSSIVANVTAILLDRQSRKVQGRRHRMRRSRRTRHFQVRKRRSIEDIYNELGPMYFRRAYTQTNKAAGKNEQETKAPKRER